MLGSTASDRKFTIVQRLMFADYGEVARRNMLIAWTCVAALAVAVLIWLPQSRLSIDRSAWQGLLTTCLYAALAVAFYLFVSHRLRNADDRTGKFLRAALERCALLFRSLILIAAIGSVGLIFSYLATALALPLRDGLLARLDGDLGFHWIAFLGAINNHPWLAGVLVFAYETTGLLTQLVVIWLAASGRGERLSEFLALLCVSSVGLAVGMLLLPAIGAFSWFEPAQHLYDHYMPGGEMWPFLGAFNALRDGALTTIDVSTVQGVVSFPSFHTMLGVITIYALRDTKALMIPVMVLNGLMIVATLPVGGHYLVDDLVGGGICIAAMLAMRHGFGATSFRWQSLNPVR